MVLSVTAEARCTPLLPGLAFFYSTQLFDLRLVTAGCMELMTPLSQFLPLQAKGVFGFPFPSLGLTSLF